MNTKNTIQSALQSVLLLLLAILLLPWAAFAQRGGDEYAVPRTVTLLPPTTYIALNAPAPGITNGWVDLKLFDGPVTVTVMVSSNLASATGSAAINFVTSPDETNYTVFTNYAASTSTTIISTNGYWGGTLTATNPWIVPGTFVTPNPATAGFAEPYWVQALYTNSTPYTVTAGTYQFGFNSDDAQRYFAVGITNSATWTNWTVGVWLTGATVVQRLK